MTSRDGDDGTPPPRRRGGRAHAWSHPRLGALGVDEQAGLEQEGRRSLPRWWLPPHSEGMTCVSAWRPHFSTPPCRRVPARVLLPTELLGSCCRLPAPSMPPPPPTPTLGAQRFLSAADKGRAPRAPGRWRHRFVVRVAGQLFGRRGTWRGARALGGPEAGGGGGRGGGCAAAGVSACQGRQGRRRQRRRARTAHLGRSKAAQRVRDGAGAADGGVGSQLVCAGAAARGGRGP